MSLCHGNSQPGVKRLKLGRPANSTKIFYTARITDTEIDQLLDFGIAYSLGHRKYEIENNDKDRFLDKAVVELRKAGCSFNKIMYIIRRKMNKVKLGCETSRVCRRSKF
jgi:hypothetical protein